jgi:hypothetical protein
VRDVDPREKARLGNIDSLARGRSLERKGGAERWKGRLLKSRGNRYDPTRVVEQRGKEQGKDGAA